MIKTKNTQPKFTINSFSKGEQNIIKANFDRELNETELGIISAMWSEHCSYKTTKHLLAKLPKDGENIAVSEGENAGAVNIGNGYLAVFKIESHNHPSYIEPYHGSATGVGGILRDIFAMGAKPIASANCLRFGDKSHPKTAYLLRQVVKGIGGYANSFGVATVTGETEFNKSYNENILVNALALGIVREENLTSSKAAADMTVMYLGASTGPDGIGGAIMASDAFGNDSHQDNALRPQIQIGDPFTGKKLCLCILELCEKKLINAVQDMGAAGLTSSSVECAHKGKVDINLYLDKVPVRSRLSALDIMLSESQERMLLIVEPKNIKEIHKIADKYQLILKEIGKTKTPAPDQDAKLKIFYSDKQIVDLPLDLLADTKFDKPAISIKPVTASTKEDQVKIDLDPSIDPSIDLSIEKALNLLFLSPNMGDKSIIWNQYDWLVQGRSLSSPASLSGIFEIPEAKCILSLSTAGSPNYCRMNPVNGFKYAVALAWRKIIANGAVPLALTNNQNFASPSNERVLQDIYQGIAAMGEAAKALNCPIISGNVSLYNQTEDNPIPPTPVMSAVGRMNDIADMIPTYPKTKNASIVMLGDIKTPSLLGSALLEEINPNNFAPDVDGVDFNFEYDHLCAKLLHQSWQKKNINNCQIIGKGGLLYSILRLCMACKSGGAIKNHLNSLAWYFGESHPFYLPRYLVTSNNPEKLAEDAEDMGINYLIIGKLTNSYKDSLIIDGVSNIILADINKKYRKSFANFYKF